MSKKMDKTLFDAVNEMWGYGLIEEPSEGDEFEYTLAWNSNGLRYAEIGDRLDEELLNKMIEVVRKLKSEGWWIRLGRSARGYTYLNLVGPDDDY
jgi:hypothetical protein